MLLIPMFTLDFLCIRPFENGNGRVGRLMSLLLLYKSGFIAGKYISMEKLVGESREAYYDALRRSTVGWHDNVNTYVPFVSYFMSLVSQIYAELDERIATLQRGKVSKADRIRDVFDRRDGRIRKQDIASYCPDISIPTIERVLGELVASGYISKVGNARATYYMKKNEIENQYNKEQNDNGKDSSAR